MTNDEKRIDPRRGALMTPYQKQFKPLRYSTTELRSIVFRFRDVEGTPAGFVRGKVKDSADLFTQYHFLFDGLTTERFVVFLLDTNMSVQAVQIVTEGILDASLVHAREVFAPAIVGRARSIIIAHNHPSGNAEPSTQDIQITKHLVDAGKLLDIQIHDHVIFTDHTFTSFAERGLI